MNEFRIAIVGAGPAGYFAAQALQNSQTNELKIGIDLFEKLPTPWGLVRTGVAPDHPKIKSVSKVFEKIASEENFRLFCGVEIGVDISITELQQKYDAVIIATGSAIGKKLGIPGEHLSGVFSAAEFVPWYNAHLEFVDLPVQLDSEVAVVIGAGNVAMDVARILAIEPSELDATDTSLTALSALHNSKIREVHLFARRGPEHAAFTSPELRELPKLEHTDVYLDKDEVEAAFARVTSAGEIPKDLNSNLEAMLAIAQAPKKNVPRSLHIHFLSTPTLISGDKQVHEITFQINQIQDGKVIATDQTMTIACGLVVSAIGYEAKEISELPLENGRVVNVNGRVSAGLYVVGWAKRGPSGVIGTNKSDSTEVVALIVADLTTPKEKSDISELLVSRKIKFIKQTDWSKLNEAEVEAGQAAGKPRIKFTDRKQIDNVLEVTQ